MSSSQPSLSDSGACHTTCSGQTQCYFPQVPFQSPENCSLELSGARKNVLIFPSLQRNCPIAFLNSCKLLACRTFCKLCDLLLLAISAELTTCWFSFDIPYFFCWRRKKNDQTVPYFCLSSIFSLSNLFSNLKPLPLDHWLCRSLRTSFTPSYVTFPARSLLSRENQE